MLYHLFVVIWGWLIIVLPTLYIIIYIYILFAFNLVIHSLSSQYIPLNLIQHGTGPYPLGKSSANAN